jgi:hypothetical protein
MGTLLEPELAHEQGIGRIILETDALQVKLSLLWADYGLAVLDGIINDLKVSLQEDFFLQVCCMFLDFFFFNKVAHELARLGATNQVSMHHMMFQVVSWD